MKKLIIFIFGLFICGSVHSAPISVDAFVSPDDVSLTSLETFRSTVVDGINSMAGDRIVDDSITTAKLDDNANPENRWNEAFNDWVYEGLLPPTSASLTSTTTTGTAYINGVRVNKSATSNTYTANKWTYVDLSDNGTYTYVETTIGDSEPSVTASSIRLARVSSDATTINTVRDDRVLSISLGGNEDHYREGFTISVTTPDAITIAPGVCYHGTTRVLKTGNTTLDLGTASDWATGISERTTSAFGFVVVNSLGSVKLTATAPTVSNTSGSTDGTLRYSNIGGTYWRVLSWFYMNGTGSGNIDDWGFNNFKDGFIHNVIQRTAAIDSSTSATNWVDLSQMDIPFYSTGKPVRMTFNGTFQNDGNNSIVYTAFSDDSGVLTSNSTSMYYVDAKSGFNCPLNWIQSYSQGGRTVKVLWKVSGNTGYQRGATYTPRTFSLEEM